MLKEIDRLTDAEKAMLQAADTLDADDAQRRSAGDDLRRHGLPTRRVEAWHYTDLRSRLSAFPPLADRPDLDGIREGLAMAGSFVETVRLPFVNGAFVREDASALPNGVKLDIGTGAAGYQGSDDAIGLMNTLLARDGVRIAIDPGSTIPETIEILHAMTRPAAAVKRHAVSLAKGAQANFIERHVSTPGIESHVNTVTGLTLEAGAEALWTIVQEEGDAATHFGQLNVTLGEGAKLTILVLNKGGRLVRREINVASRGEGASLDIRGVNLVGAGSHLDVTTSLAHEVPSTTANEIFRNVATGDGVGVFQGDIKVTQIAQKTDARMACNTLLLSDDASFSAKPELEIFADDVQCAHGATVTDIEDDHLFYLRARGIPQKQARALLVKAFVEELFDDLEDDALHAALNARIEEWLDIHG